MALEQLHRLFDLPRCYCHFPSFRLPLSLTFRESLMAKQKGRRVAPTANAALRIKGGRLPNTLLSVTHAVQALSPRDGSRRSDLSSLARQYDMWDIWRLHRRSLR
jgi:hypothetical protein